MVKVQIVSDLHLEFDRMQSNNYILPKTGDILILAGDIDIGSNAQEWIKTLDYEQILFLTGNHEYYHNEFFDINNSWIQFENTINNFIYMNNKYIEIDNILFIGCTLWTDMNHYQQEIAEKNLNDYIHTTIKYNTEIERKLKPFDTVLQFHYSYDFLLKYLSNIEKNKYRKIVVITHHTPLNNSIPNRFKNDSTNCCFTTHIPELVDMADIWIHGHTHDSFDYKYNNTRIICNPRGYVGYQINPYFKNSFTVTI